MKKYFEILKDYIEQHPPNYGDADSVLGMLMVNKEATTNKTRIAAPPLFRAGGTR